jgi:hypothetical protein
VIWHYTSGEALRAILASGVLRPGPANMRVPGEVPAVWFTKRGDWDPAVGLGKSPSEDEVRETVAAVLQHGARAAVEHLRRTAGSSAAFWAENGGLARIGVDGSTAPFTWEDFVRAGFVPPRDAYMREMMDVAAGSDPGDWRASIVPVPAEKWLAIETRSGTRPGERWELAFEL